MDLWWILSFIVHVQALILIISILPYPTSPQWHWIVNSRAVLFLRDLAHINMWSSSLALFSICLLYFLVALRNWAKTKDDEEKLPPLALAQRDYYISGTGMLLCMIVPRVIAIRGENARLQRGIPDENSESILKKVVMELIAIVREAETDIDGSEDRSNNKFFRSHSIAGSSNRREEENSAVLQSILKELERLNKGKKGSIDGRLLDNQEIKHLQAFYEKIKSQNDSHTNRCRERLARSRFSTSMPMGLEDPTLPANYHYNYS